MVCERRNHHAVRDTTRGGPLPPGATAEALPGLAGGGLAAWAAGFSHSGSPSALALAFLNCGFPRGLEGVGIALSFALYALFGAEVGVATLPFAGDGAALVGRTLAHFGPDSARHRGAVVGGSTSECVRRRPSLVPLALVYLLVWLGRWVGWYAEVSAIRERRGLAPGPSPFHWRESPCPMSPSPPCCACFCPLAVLRTVRRRRRAGALRPALPLPPAARRRLLFRPVPGEAAGLLPPLSRGVRGSCFASPAGKAGVQCG
ncbi:MAG: hypothetical protein ACLRWQ_05730 [Flavonifractor plautii]